MRYEDLKVGMKIRHHKVQGLYKVVLITDIQAVLEIPSGSLTIWCNGDLVWDGCSEYNEPDLRWFCIYNYNKSGMFVIPRNKNEGYKTKEEAIAANSSFSGIQGVLIQVDINDSTYKWN